MQLLLLCCFDEELWAKMPEAQRGQIMQEYNAFMQGLVTSGHLRASAKLHPTSMAATVHERHGKRVITDGPFAHVCRVHRHRSAISCVLLGDDGRDDRRARAAGGEHGVRSLGTGMPRGSEP